MDQDEPPLDINNIAEIDDDVLDKEGTRIKVRQTFLVPVFQHLYFTIFKQFCQAWVEERPNIMDFTQFIDKIYDKKFKPQAEGVVMEYIY